MTIREVLDEDVYLALQAARKFTGESISQVLRRYLDLPDPPSQERCWVIKYGEFTHGTQFKAIHKGKVYYAVVDDGALLFQHVRYKSPSAAARVISKGVVTNGWKFWMVLIEDDENNWRYLKEFKSRGKVMDRYLLNKG
jgi:hypothetical protein